MERPHETFQEMLVAKRKKQKLQGYQNCFRGISKASRKLGMPDGNHITIKEFKKVSGKSNKLYGI